MTKEELLEDVQVGDIIKIYTESNEILLGKIIDFGESGLKILVLNTNKAKRIVYGKITEYDIEDIYENEDTISESEVTYNNNSEKNINILEEKRNETNRTFDEKKIFTIDRKVIFDKASTPIDLELIREEWKKKLDINYMDDYVRVLNILNYAKKVNEYTVNSDRVKKAIAEYKKIASKVRMMNVFIALIYHEFDDVKTAIDFYHKGGAFDVEFQLAEEHGYDGLFEKAVLAVEYNNENESVIKWLCEYAVKNNDFAVISHIINHSNVYLGKVLLFWYADKPEIQKIPNKEDIFANENVIYLKHLDAINNKENSEHIKVILSNATDIPADKNNEILLDKDIIYKGTITYYNSKGGNGWIKSVDGESIYFYIRQVKDAELQRILATETNFKRKVTYTKGINYMGNLAADAIELDEKEHENNIKSEQKYEGFINDYDIDKQRGWISSGDESFNFQFNEIVDPLLYADIMSQPYLTLDLTVRFNARDYISKKTKKKSRIACNIQGVKEKSQQEIDEFIHQRNMTKKEAKKR